MLANLPPKRITRKVLQENAARSQGRLRTVREKKIKYSDYIHAYMGYFTNSCQFHQKNCNISNQMHTSQIFTAATKYKKK